MSFISCYFLINQDKSHRLNLLAAIISISRRVVSTRVGVIPITTSTKPDSGVTGVAVVLLVTKDTNSCFGSATGAIPSVEPFPATVGLQGSLGTN